MTWFTSAMGRLVVGRLRWLLVSGDERDAEILALRHQVLVLQSQSNRPRFTDTDTDTDRTILALVSSAFGRSRLAEIFLIVQPATVVGWHRRLVARHWTHSPETTGRPPVQAEIRRLAIRLARENPTWGYRGVHGELCRLGYTVAAPTIWKLLRAAGIDATPGRTGPTWAEFIRFQARREPLHDAAADEFPARTVSRATRTRSTLNPPWSSNHLNA